MFRKFRIKIIIVFISILAVVFAGILIAIYATSYQRSVEHTYIMLKQLGSISGFKKLSSSDNGIYDASKFYLVRIMDNQVKKIANDKDSGYSDEALGKLATDIIQKKKHRGTVGSLSYAVNYKVKASYVAFYNNGYQTIYFDTLFYDILIFGGLGLLLLFLISVLLSYWLVKPVESAFMKQKQFISDASHELKTPVAIISSNAEALQREIGENKWLNYIHNETFRLNGLVNDLLQLATIETYEERKTYTKINLSETVMSIVLSFESIAYENQVNLKENIEENIYAAGDKIKLGQLTSILLDNALNHTEKGGDITVGLMQQRDKKILTVSNTGKEIPLAERELIFERFYRSDEARTRENGRYGLGLAIAKAITRAHNGRITVICKDNCTIFKVVI